MSSPSSVLNRSEVRSFGIELEKRVFLIHGEETVVVEYELRRVGSIPADLRLELRPLIAWIGLRRRPTGSDQLPSPTRYPSPTGVTIDLVSLLSICPESFEAPVDDLRGVKGLDRGIDPLL